MRAFADEHMPQCVSTGDKPSRRRRRRRRRRGQPRRVGCASIARRQRLEVIASASTATRSESEHAVARMHAAALQRIMYTQHVCVCVVRHRQQSASSH